MGKRFLSLLMSLLLCFSMLPPTAFAENAETETITMREKQEQQKEQANEENEEKSEIETASEQETQETDTSTDKTEPQSDESVPSLQSNEENEVALQASWYDASIGNTKYSTLQEAFAAAKSGDTVKLLRDVELGKKVILNVKTYITLDTNGCAITSDYTGEVRTNYDVTAIEITDGGKLTIVNSAATSKELHVKLLTRYGGIIDATSDANQTLYYVAISDNSKLICTTGTIKEIAFVTAMFSFDLTLVDAKGYCTINYIENYNDTVDELLSNHPGLTLHYDDGSKKGQIPRDWAIKSTNGKGKLWVAECDEHDRGSLLNTKCQYCYEDMTDKLVATSTLWTNNVRYYESISDALNDTNAPKENHTVKLLKRITDDFAIEKDIAIDLNEQYVNGTVTVNSGNTLTLDGAGSIKTVKVSGALDIQNDEALMQELIFESAPTTKLSHGIFGKFDSSKTGMKAHEFLAEGYAFASTVGGEVVNGYVNDKLDHVKIVSHEHDMSTGECVCGLSCSHPNGFVNGVCSECGASCPHKNMNET